MKTRQAPSLQRPLTAHEGPACSLGEKEGAGGEERQNKNERDSFPGNGCVEARVLTRGNSPGPPFLTDFTNLNALHVPPSMGLVELRLLYIQNVQHVSDAADPAYAKQLSL